MGGQNHHQCSGSIRHTTLLAKSRCLAEAEVLLANAVLEDAMVAELYDSVDHAQHFSRQIIPHLEASLRHIQDTRDMTERVIQITQEKPYQNASILANLDFTSLRKALQANGVPISDDTIWNRVASTVRSQGVIGLYRAFISDLDRMAGLTCDVMSAIKEAVEVSARGEKMIDIFERNVGGFKPRFARLITSWSVTSLFLSYSAIATTEAHLVASNFPSLKKPLEVVAQPVPGPVH